jgi:hypothetical protein
MSEIVSRPLPPPPHAAAVRFSRSTLIALFTGGLAGVVVLVVAAVLLREPPGPTGCTAIVCPIPLTNAQRVGVRWDSDLNLSTEYPDHLPLRDSEARRLELGNSTFNVRLDVAPASEANPLQMLQHELDEVRGAIPTLDEDCVEIGGTQWENACPVHRDRLVLGPSVGYVDGIGGMWGGTSDNGDQLEVVVLIAQRDDVTAAIVVTTTVPFGGWGSDWQGYNIVADDISNSIIWPGER